MITRNKIIFLVLLLYSFGSSRDLKILHMEGTFDIDEDGQYEFAAVEFDRMNGHSISMISIMSCLLYTSDAADE